MLFSNASEPVCYIWKIITNRRKYVDYQRSLCGVGWIISILTALGIIYWMITL